MKVYVLTEEPYHENSSVVGVYASLELARHAYGAVGPCKCPSYRGPHPTPGWEPWELEGVEMWVTTCERFGSVGQIEAFELKQSDGGE